MDGVGTFKRPAYLKNIIMGLDRTIVLSELYWFVKVNCHTAMSSGYELLILEPVWIDNVELEREEVKTTCLCNVYLRSEP